MVNLFPVLKCQYLTNRKTGAGSTPGNPSNPKATHKQTKVLTSADLLNSGNPLKMAASNTSDLKLYNNMGFVEFEREYQPH